MKINGSNMFHFLDYSFTNDISDYEMESLFSMFNSNKDFLLKSENLFDKLKRFIIGKKMETLLKNNPDYGKFRYWFFNYLLKNFCFVVFYFDK